MGVVVAAVQVQTDDLVPVALNGVLVGIYDASTDALLASGLTGSGSEPAGQISFSLSGSSSPGAAYTMRLYQAGTTFPLGPTQRILVIDPLLLNQTNIFEVTAHVPVLPESTDPDLCLITGYLTDVSLRPLTDAVIHIFPMPQFVEKLPSDTADFSSRPSVVRNLIPSRPIKVTSDQNGRVQFELPRGGVFGVHAHGMESPVSIRDIINVPDQAGFRFEDIFFCYVTTVTFSPAGPLSVSVGTSVDVDIDVVLSDTRHLTLAADVAKLIQFSIADLGIASVTYRGDGILTVEGLVPGTTTLQAERLPNTVAPRRPAVADLIFTPPSVVVT